MGSSRTRTNSTTNTNQNQTNTTPGTAPGTALIPGVQGTVDDALSLDAYNGPRVAGPGDLFNQATYGELPDTFVPQRTTTDNPFQVNSTYVAPNAQEGIDAGLAAGHHLNTRLPGLVNAGFDRWGEILQGGGNPNLDALIQAISQDANENYAVNAGDRALMAGAEGAFGGTGYNQGEAWAAEQQADSLNRTIAEIRASDYYNNQQLLQAAPGGLAGLAGVLGIPAEMLGEWGGLRQENLAGEAANTDYNNQVAQNNLWQTGTLQDSNTAAGVQDALAQWQAQFAADSQVAANEVDTVNRNMAQEQAGYDNDYLNWLAQWENNQAQQNALGNAMNIFATIPGGTSNLVGRSQTQSTTTQSANPLQTIGGLVGAGLQMFAPGGMFSGSLSALGGLLGGGSGGGQSTPMNYAPVGQPVSPWIAPTVSDSRVKKNIEFVEEDERGVRWYEFDYKWGGVRQIGVMAEELEEIAPQFVYTVNGLKAVDYASLEAWAP